MIDLRSDTVTKPCSEMLKSMAQAQVGDDVFGEDPTVNELESFASDFFQFESALFCPSGTMTNQIAIFLQSGPMTEVLLHPDSHVYQYEGGGISAHSRASIKFLNGERGKILAKDIVPSLNPKDVHRPKSVLVSIENTTNRGGGACYTKSELSEISRTCKENNLRLHLDGARIANALIHTKMSPQSLGTLFNSMSVCLSKGLGAPIGSLLLGSREFIQEARRVRKLFGGGMRQAGFIASAGLFALKNNWNKLEEDHQKAKKLESCLKELSWVNQVLPVETNIVIFEVKNREVSEVVEKLKQKNIISLVFGPQKIRFVTHLDVSYKDIENVSEQLKKI